MKNKRNIPSNKIMWNIQYIYMYIDKINSNSNFVIILILQKFIILYNYETYHYVYFKQLSKYTLTIENSSAYNTFLIISIH